MKHALLLGMGLLTALHAHVQDTMVGRDLDEVIIYSNKFAEQKKNVVQKIEVVSAQRIALVNAQNTGDLLSGTGNVFVQKSQQGGSSPVIRGFEASRVLLVIDGIRMNNAIYRAGHLQNVITVDQNMLERIEVLYGPASTLYGSDALGGVVHMRTKNPKLSVTDKMVVDGSAFARYSSANNEKTAHFDISLGGKKLAWLQSYNFSDFDDLKMGRNYRDDYPDFGRRTHYVTTINGIDSVVRNEDDLVQRFSGYRQWDITQKLLFRPASRTTHVLNVQYSNSSDIPRYDRLQDLRNGALRYAEWYYGPQLRTLAAYELSVEGLGFFTQFKSIISYQHIEESRNQRDYRRYDRLDSRKEDLDVYAFTVDGRKLWAQHELTVGFDGQLNDLQSRATRTNIQTGAVSPLDTRYPNGKNSVNHFGVYAQHIFKFGDGKFVLNDGIRFQYISLHSTIADNSIFQLPFSEIRQNNGAVTGNIGLVYLPAEGTRITAGLASGFRNPNIDDLARIFESNNAIRQVVFPNPDIRPEYTYNGDLGISKTFGKLFVEATGFYTLFRNAIALAPFQLNGQDSVDYNGVNSRVYANQNVNRACLYGAHASVRFDASAGLRLSSTINYTFGRLQHSNKTTVPLDHIPPLYGRTAITYNRQKVHAELYALYNGWKHIEHYNPSGEDNLQYATIDGIPSWITFNFKTTLSLRHKLSLQLGVENIIDRNYRQFASGFSAPGRNFIAALRSNF